MKSVEIIYQDQKVMVINKPAGLVVNRAESVKVETLQDWVEENFSHKVGSAETDQFLLAGDRGRRSGIVHRLDKDTSGVMVIAKTKLMFERLKLQFKKRETEKTYVALLHGKLEPKTGAMSLPLARSSYDRKKFTVTASGRQAETAWQVLKYYEKDGEVLTLVKLFPKTGRTHQLRVHLKHLGHPLVSDVHYLSRKRIKRDLAWCPRQFLHAQKLCFKMGDKKQCFEAQLAVDLKTALRSINEKQIK